MKRNWRLGILILAVLISAAMSAFGQAGIPTFRGPSGCAQDLIQAVGLTAAQQSTLEVLRQQTADAIKPIFDQIPAFHQQIDTALVSASPDPCAIGNLEIQAYGLRAQIQTIQKNAEATFVASLTADQQTKYAAFIAANPECAAFPSRQTRVWIGPTHA
jgi:LTXXQ motif family protein